MQQHASRIVGDTLKLLWMGALLYFKKDMSHPIPESYSKKGGINLHFGSYCPMYPLKGLGTYQPDFWLKITMDGDFVVFYKGHVPSDTCEL